MVEKIRVPEELKGDYRTFLSGLSKVIDRVYTSNSEIDVRRAKVLIANKVSILVVKAYRKRKEK